MSFVTKDVVDVLVSALATCGGTAGALFETAKSIRAAGGGELWEILPMALNEMASRSLWELEAEAIDGKILPESVLRRYGLPSHFSAMNREAEAGMVSIAQEIPAEIRAIAHTLLPLKNGIYSNEGRIITFEGLVPLGPQEGILVAHLSGVFASRCPQRVIDQLLFEQASDPDFLKMADKVTVLDYRGTTLQTLTKRAKEALAL